MGVLAAGAHSDYGVLTALWTDGTPGLQILDPDDGTWRDPAHVPGALVCNVGDLCERWTNGVFKSTVHRVVTAGTSERFSAAFFWEPNFDAVVKAVPRCVTDDNPAKFPPVVYGEYISRQVQANARGVRRRGEGNLREEDVASKGAEGGEFVKKTSPRVGSRGGSARSGSAPRAWTVDRARVDRG